MLMERIAEQFKEDSKLLTSQICTRLQEEEEFNWTPQKVIRILKIVKIEEGEDCATIAMNIELTLEVWEGQEISFDQNERILNEFANIIKQGEWSSHSDWATLTMSRICENKQRTPAVMNFVRSYLEKSEDPTIYESCPILFEWIE